MQRKILVFGANGQVGREVLRRAGSNAIGFDHAAIDICAASTVKQAVRENPPSAIVNAAGYTAVDKAESEPDVALSVNRDGAEIVAQVAASAQVPLIHISTDYVFDGTKRTPYGEDDPVGPLNIYGMSKAEGECVVRDICPQHVILRTSWIYSPYGTNFVRTMLHLGTTGAELKVVNDQIGCPTSAAELATAIMTILGKTRQSESMAWGTYHYRGRDIVTWYGFAKLIFEVASSSRLPMPRIIPIATHDYPCEARRPHYSVLSMEKIDVTWGIKPKPARQGVAACLAALL